MITPDPRWQKRKSEDQEDWMVTYADMVTLLLTFFVLIVSMSKIDMVKFEQMQKGVAREMGRKDILQPTESLKIDLDAVVRELKLEDVTHIGQDDQGLTLEMASSAFYRPGSADIRDDARPALRQIADTLTQPRYAAFQVEVQGHTDDVPVSTPQYPSNWELSAARATQAVRLFIADGLKPTRLKAVGFADIMPKVPNRDANGNPLPENQQMNRRIVVRIFPR